MLIEMNDAFATPRTAYAKGRRYTVDDVTGANLVKKGTAVEIHPEGDKRTGGEKLDKLPNPRA